MKENILFLGTIVVAIAALSAVSFAEIAEETIYVAALSSQEMKSQGKVLVAYSTWSSGRNIPTAEESIKKQIKKHGLKK